ncbi:hypothetical protein ACF0H5_008904 [Mactra antiquata]
MGLSSPTRRLWTVQGTYYVDNILNRLCFIKCLAFTEWHQCRDRMYYVHDASYGFVTSISYCESIGANMTTVHEDDIKDGAYLKTCLSSFIPDGEHWIPAIYHGGTWINVKGLIEVYVVVGKKSHQMASIFCAKLNATLATFPGSIKYFNVGQYLKLHGLFWIEEVSLSDDNDECASLDMSVSPSIKKTKCTVPLESICSRPIKINDTEIVRDAVFVEMIKNMTVNEKQTSRSIRKYISAVDKRSSAKVVGSLCGGIAMATVLGIFILFDVQRLFVHIVRCVTK